MRALAAAALLVATACGSLTETEDGVAFLDVIRPVSTSLQVGATLQLEARALDARGQPVTAAIRWSSADDFLLVDESTGLVTAVAEGTGGRIQARTGTGSRALFSNFLTLTVVPPPAPASPPR